MKKRVVTLLLILVLACVLAVTVGAADTERTPAGVEKTPEELYQEYLDVAVKINEEYGTDIKIIPFEEMEPSNMPTIEKVEEDVRDLANMKKQFAEQFGECEGMAEPES